MVSRAVAASLALYVISAPTFVSAQTPQTPEQRLLRLEEQVRLLAQVQLPKGTIIFTQEQTCPAGFIELTALRGRYVVGLPDGGEPNAQVGKPLGNKERRNVVAYHQHSIQPDQLQHVHAMNTNRLDYRPDQNGVGEGAKYPISDQPNTGQAAFTHGTIVTDFAGLTTDKDEAINAPYIQLLGCVHG